MASPSYGLAKCSPHLPLILHLEGRCTYRTGTVGKTKVTLLVIPSSLVETTLKLLHDAPSAGHPGRDKILSMARAKYYWPTLRLEIEKHIAQCLLCAETKGTTKTAPILEYPLLAGPFDVIGIDLLQLPCSHQGSSYVLVITSVDLLSWLLYPISLLRQWLMPLSLPSSAPTQLLVFSSVIMG